MLFSHGIHFTEFLDSRIHESAFFTPTDESEIIKIVKGLNNTSSCGHDGISTKLVKKIIYLIAKPLSHVFNLSLCSGIVPDPLKIG